MSTPTLDPEPSDSTRSVYQPSHLQELEYFFKDTLHVRKEGHAVDRHTAIEEGMPRQGSQCRGRAGAHLVFKEISPRAAQVSSFSSKKAFSTLYLESGGDATAIRHQEGRSGTGPLPKPGSL